MNKIFNNFKELARTNKIKATLVIIMLSMLTVYIIGAFSIIIPDSSIEEIITFIISLIIVVPLAITFWYNIITNRKFRNFMWKIGLIIMVICRYIR